MSFCSFCGKELSIGSKFCSNCGYPVGEEPNSKRVSVSGGKLHKCPHCGDLLSAFVSECPSCGYELRGANATSSVRELALKLEAIEATREQESSKSIKKFLGVVPLTSTDKQKISLIRSFAIPNTKEDLYEFLILSESNIDIDLYDGSIEKSDARLAVSDAWRAKFEQAYRKAKLVFAKDHRLSEIQAIYDDVQRALKKTKAKTTKSNFLILVGVLFFFGVLFSIIWLISPGIVEKETARLEAIVVEIEVALEAGEYKLALLNANSLEYSASINNNEFERKWDIQREVWIDKVLEEAAANGVVLERPETETATPKPTVAPTPTVSPTPTVAPTPTIGFDAGTYKDITIENFIFSVPNYWEEDGTKDDFTRYYAETNGKVSMFAISYPVDEVDVATLSLLYDDNENMIEAIESWYNGCEVTGHEAFKSDFGVEGIVYDFSFTLRLVLKKYNMNGKLFCFPSPEDNRWFYVVIGVSDNTDTSYADYIQDYTTILASIRES